MQCFLKFQFHFSQNPGPCRIPGPRATFKSQSQTPLGKFFELIPGGCPGDVPSWNSLGNTFNANTDAHIMHVKIYPNLAKITRI